MKSAIETAAEKKADRMMRGGGFTCGRCGAYGFRTSGGACCSYASGEAAERSRSERKRRLVDDMIDRDLTILDDWKEGVR